LTLTFFLVVRSFDHTLQNFLCKYSPNYIDMFYPIILFALIIIYIKVFDCDWLISVQLIPNRSVISIFCKSWNGRFFSLWKVIHTPFATLLRLSKKKGRCKLQEKLCHLAWRLKEDCRIHNYVTTHIICRHHFLKARFFFFVTHRYDCSIITHHIQSIHLWFCFTKYILKTNYIINKV
jgi:hypothetical protein